MKLRKEAEKQLNDNLRTRKKERIIMILNKIRRLKEDIRVCERDIERIEKEKVEDQFVMEGERSW